MNPNEIKKALECCIKAETRGDCKKLRCPAYRKEGCAYFLKSSSSYDEDVVHKEMCKDALAYIEQLEAKVERLNNSGIRASSVEDWLKHCNKLRAEAYKEFAERLCAGRVSNDPVVIAVKTELKEIVGDEG